MSVLQLPNIFVWKFFTFFMLTAIGQFRVLQLQTFSKFMFIKLVRFEQYIAI